MTQSTSDSIQQILPVFSMILSRQALQEHLKKMKVKMYWRAYTPLIVLWGFIFQRLQADHTCDNYVDYLHAGGADQLDPTDKHVQPLSWRLRSEQNAGYVQGRNRLPLALLHEAMRLVYQQIQAWLGEQGTWHGHAVRFLDGTTFSLKPLGDLAMTYGHSSNQRGEHYWVQVRAVASFDLMSQGAVALAEGPYTTCETTLVLPVLQSDPQKGALYIGDRNFGVYRVLQAVRATSHEALFRLQKQQWQALLRRNGLHCPLPGESCRCVWKPSPEDKLLEGVPAPAIEGRLLYVRLEEKGFRPIDLYLFTTLTDEVRYGVCALAALYGRRYLSAEVDFRHLKTTMQLVSLEVRSAAMFRKDLAAGLLAYNLVRAVMTYSALLAGCQVTTLSFVKAKRRLCRTLFNGQPSWVSQPGGARQHLCSRLQACVLPPQPNKVKHEPRRTRYKRRRYLPLSGDRHTARLQHLQQLQPCPIS